MLSAITSAALLLSALVPAAAPDSAAMSAGRGAKFNPYSWVSGPDGRAIKNSGQHGRVGLRIVVDDTGQPLACQVLTSSGRPELDRRTCELPMHGHFEPALDEAGRPIASAVRVQLNWGDTGSDRSGFASPLIIATNTLSARTKPTLSVREVLSAGGELESCVITPASEPHPASDDAQICGEVAKDLHRTPVTDTDGQPVRGLQTRTVQLKAFAPVN